MGYGVENSAATSRIIRATPAARPNDRASNSPTKRAGQRALVASVSEPASVSSIEAVVIVSICAEAVHKCRQPLQGQSADRGAQLSRWQRA